MSQPAVSKCLDRLRREFDDALLVRDGSRMRLTPRAQELLPLLDAALRQVSAVFASQGPFDPVAARGRVRIGANDYVQLVLGTRLLHCIRTRAPQVTLEFRPVGMLHPAHLLADGMVDIAIGTDLHIPSLRCQPLYHDPFVCVASPDAPALPDRLDVAAFSELLHLDVSPSGIGLLRAMIDRALAELGGRRELRCMCSSFMAVPAMLAATGLVTLVPRGVFRLFPPGSVRELALDFELPPYDVSLWWHNVTHGDALARWVREQLIELAANAAL